MKKTTFIFSLIAAAQIPALAHAQSLSDDLGTTDLPEVDVIFKCHQDAYTMDAAAGGLAGKLAESKDRVYGALLFPNDSQFAYVAAPYKVSGPAFFEQDGVKFACVTVQSVKSLAASESGAAPVAAPDAEEAPPADAGHAATDDGAITAPDADPEPVAVPAAPAATSPDFSGIHDGNVLAPSDTAQEPAAPADAIPSAEGDDGVAGVPSVETGASEPVLAPISMNPNEPAPAPADHEAAPIAAEANTAIVVPEPAAEPAPAVADAPVAPSEEAPLAPIINKPAAEEAIEPEPAITPVAPLEPAPVSDSNTTAIADAAQTPTVVPEPQAADTSTQNSNSIPAEGAPVATDSNAIFADAAPVATDSNANLAEAAPVATDSNVMLAEAAPNATDSNIDLSPAAQEPNNASFEAPVAQEANTAIMVPEVAAPELAVNNNVVIPNAPEAPFALAPEADDPNTFHTQDIVPVSSNPNVAVIPEASENGEAVVVGQDVHALDPNGATPSAIVPVLTKTTPKSDLVRPEGEPENAAELEAQRNEAFWANFDD